MKKGLIILSIVLSALIAPAQQIGMYSHYFYKPMIYNPAFTGSEGATNAMLVNRNQWTDFKGAPKLTILTLDGSLVEKKVGLGISLISDRKGITNRTSGNLSYSYRITINNDMHVLFGVSAGIINQTLDFSKTLVENNTDPNLFTDLQRKTTFDGSAGIGFVWNNLEIGAAVPQLLQNKINYVDNTNIRGYYAMARHYMATAKYRFYIVEDKGISIVPQALVRFVPNTPFQYDGTLNVDWKDKFWLGATYKSGYAVAAHAGFCIHKQLYLGYSYDFIIGPIGTYAGTSHELMINFKFGENKKSKNYTDSVPAAQQGNADYEELLDNLQAQVGETEKKIKELEERMKKQGLKSDVPQINPKLNNLLFQQLLKKIEVMFDDPNSSQDDIQALRNEIASFLDSDFSDDVTQKALKKQYELLNKSQDAVSVLVKGGVVLQNTGTQNNYTTVNINIAEKETGKLIGTYLPNATTGKYLFILTPGKHYVITAENPGYETYTEDFTPNASNESYEVSHAIRMKAK